MIILGYLKQPLFPYPSYNGEISFEGLSEVVMLKTTLESTQEFNSKIRDYHYNSYFNARLTRVLGCVMLIQNYYLH